MRDCLRVDGENTVPLSHIGKAQLRRMGKLPVSLAVPNDYIHRARTFLQTYDDGESSDDDSVDLYTPIFGGPAAGTRSATTTSSSSKAKRSSACL